MSATRLSLIEILQQEFKSDMLKTKCCETSQTFLQKRDLSRIFNGFPLMLPKAEFILLCSKFLEILKRIHSSNGDAKVLTEKWVAAIAKRGAEEMLDEKGHLKSEFIKLLGWSRFIPAYNKEDVTTMVSAYVGAITSQAVDYSAQKIKKQDSSYLLFSDALNTDKRRWINEVLTPLWDVTERKTARWTKARDIPAELDVFLSRKSAYLLRSIGFGVAAAAGAGFLIYQALEKDHGLESMPLDTLRSRP